MLVDKWNADHKFPWATIKDEWSKIWDLEKPILLEKSPPNLLRAADIEQAFSPCWFIVMMRDPYALCEGLARRRNRRNRLFRTFSHTPPDGSNNRDYAMEFAANLWARFAAQQIKNIKGLERVLYFTYEELTENPASVMEKIVTFLPELDDLDATQKFRVHSVTGTDARELMNMNETKWQCLLKREIRIINTVLEKRQEDLRFLGYRVREPDPFQDVRAAMIRSKSLVLKFKNEGREAMLGRTTPTTHTSKWRWLSRMTAG
jgi:hypothetical protein